MADECTDIANKEQFTICIRWVDSDLQDHADFIGLYKVDSICTDCLAFHKGCFALDEHQFVKCQGQYYDGTSNMSGIRSGVAAQIISEEECTLHTLLWTFRINTNLDRSASTRKIRTQNSESQT